MAALSTGMQHLDSLSLGIFSYLLAHKRVSHLEPKEMVGASHVQLAIWEQVRLTCYDLIDPLSCSAFSTLI